MLPAMQVAFGFGNAFFVSLICLSVRTNPSPSRMSRPSQQIGATFSTTLRL